MTLLLAIPMARPVRTFENHYQVAKSPNVESTNGFQFSCFSHFTAAPKIWEGSIHTLQLIKGKSAKDVLVFLNDSKVDY